PSFSPCLRLARLSDSRTCAGPNSEYIAKENCTYLRYAGGQGAFEHPLPRGRYCAPAARPPPCFYLFSQIHSNLSSELNITPSLVARSTAFCRISISATHFNTKTSDKRTLLSTVQLEGLSVRLYDHRRALTSTDNQCQSVAINANQWRSMADDR